MYVSVVLSAGSKEQGRDPPLLLKPCLALDCEQCNNWALACCF